ncbi:hypothetical protein PV325_001320, partial [Microctonus aethiopoides]
LRLDIDPFDDFLEFTEKCCDSNPEGRPLCHKCLKWSGNSAIQFNEFFDKNLNRCFLLNLPRSIHSPGPVSLSSPHAQCRCFGYELYGKAIDRSASMIPSNECNTPVPCTKVNGNEKYFQPTVRPFDGTPCGKKKVCWKGVCHRVNA